MAPLRLLCLLATLSVASTSFASSWPAAPVEGATHPAIDAVRAQAEPASHKGSHARMLAAAAPSYGEIADYNIILFSSIAMVFVFYFSIMALVNMDVGNDSLLYSKSKSD